MTDDATIDALAHRLFQEHRERRPYRALTDVLDPTDLDAAYRVQAALHRLLLADGRGPIAGHKIALTSRAMQELCGVDRPLAGAVFAAATHRSPATLRAADFVHLGIECEIAVELGADLGPDGAPYDRAAVARQVTACRPAFELIEDWGADYGAIDAASLAGDNCWNGGVVLGAARSDWQDLDLTAATTRLWLNGEAVGEGVSGDAMGHPYEAVAWLANLRAEQGETLRAGSFVMTGSTITTRFPGPGDHCRFEVEGLGDVELTLTD